MKPVVGVMPLWDDQKNSLWMLPGYMDGIGRAGGIPVMFPLTGSEDDIRQLADAADGLLFTGGHDVLPGLYGEAPHEKTVCCRARDDMELLCLKYAMKRHKPILGICRGIQLINAALGGTLYQDLPSQRPSDVNHNQPKPYDRPSHTVDIAGGSPLREILHADRIAVNSLHHQAVKDAAPGLSVTAVSEDGLIEGICKPDEKFFHAIQWHAEMMPDDPASIAVFRAFVRAMR